MSMSKVSAARIPGRRGANGTHGEVPLRGTRTDPGALTPGAPARASGDGRGAPSGDGQDGIQSEYGTDRMLCASARHNANVATCPSVWGRMHGFENEAKIGSDAGSVDLRGPVLDFIILNRVI